MSLITGSLLLAAPVALAAGAVSFASPCVLPLVPGYLSFVAGMSGADVAAPKGSVQARPARRVTTSPARVLVGAGAPVAVPAAAALAGEAAAPLAPTRRRGTVRSRTVLGALLFVLGFTAVFVAYGALFGGLGAALREHQVVLDRVLGSITIVLGLLFAGLLGRLPVLQREFRSHRLPAAGLAGAPLLGGLFGLGWTPCIGPTLSGVLTLAASESTATAGRGALLTVFYCLGLGLPFVAVAAAVHRGFSVLAAIRRHTRAITLVGGLLLVAIGVLEVTGTWSAWVISLQHLTNGWSPGL